MNKIKNKPIQLKKPNKIEEKMTLPFEMKSFKTDEKYFYFEGYLSTFGNIDRGDDVVVKGAFKESLKQHMPTLLWSHKSGEPLGVFDELKEDDVGLYIKARMPLADKFVKDRIVPQLEIGSIKSMSIGYSPWGKDAVEYTDGVRYLKRLFLWEGSLVVIPMNAEANLKTKAAVPFDDELPIASRQTSWDPVSALGRVREWAGVEDGGIEDPENQNKYKRAFLWFDHEDPDILSYYQLQIADIINGTLTVIPRAVFAAAAKLRGGRGGVYFYFPDDRPRVVRTVEKYYEKIGLESPFGKTFRIDSFLAHEARDLQKLLREGVTMGQLNAKIFISALKSHFEKSSSGDNQPEVEEKEWRDVLNSIREIKSKNFGG